MNVLKRDYLNLDDGSEFLNPKHFYSYDIDLFGKGSFFQYCNRTATVEGKYKLYPITSSTADDWYSSLLEVAADYDRNNYNSLLFAIPEHIRESNDNNQFITFVNMIGQHFDIMYFYTNHLLKKTPPRGMKYKIFLSLLILK